MRKAAETLGGIAVVVCASGGLGTLLADQQHKKGAPKPGVGGKGQQVGVPHEYDPTHHRYVYLIDVTKCIGCGACVRACGKENDVPEGFFRTWIERYIVSTDGEHVDIDSPNGGKDGFQPKVTGFEVAKAFFVPKICNHCTQTPCVQLCPVGASYRSPDGVVLVDETRCIGCGYCVQACPFGSRFIHPKTHTASKCTLCYHRITRGLNPACVDACPTGTRQFGDRERKGDPVWKQVVSGKVHVLKPELLTEPNAYYLGLSYEVR
ncbi:MAG: 4Fe-4S dicluster domain-containing protein [Myxococcales bacterium]|nr:4Fe-4S dicluster domain-containing protein [Myxococcales bacterium]